MQLNQMNSFLMVAKLGSITKAASLMYVTQPAITKSIATLERELGVKLFDRHGKNLSLSTAGQQILPNVQAIMDECVRIKAICSALMVDKPRVTFTAVVTTILVPELVSSFKKQYPEVELIQLKPTPEGVDIIVDMAIDDEPSGNRTYLLREDLVLIVPSYHPLAGRLKIDLTEIRDYPIISFDESAMLRKAEDHFCALAGFTPKRQREIITHNDLHGVISNEEGVVFFPARTGGLDSIDSNRIVRIENPHCYRYVYAEITSGDGANQHYVKAFYDHIIAFFSQI